MKILNPNCSEVVWKLKLGTKYSRKHETWTDSYPNGALQTALTSIKALTKDKNKIDQISFIELDNLGGGGNYEYVQDSFEIAKRVAKGELTLKQAQTEDRESW